MNVPAFLAARLISIRNRKLSRAAFEGKRLRRFRRFAAFVQRRSPWYRRVMAELKIDPSDCRPEQFPVLTKRDIIDHFDEIVTRRDVKRQDIEEFLHRSHNPEELFRGRYTVIHTSGSSGEVGLFIYDKPDWARAIAQVASLEGFRYASLGRKRVGFLGATQGHFAGVTISTATRSAPLSLIYKTRCFEINRPLAEAVAGLNALQPHVLFGYGTAMKALAEKQLEGELHISPESVSNSGEPLLDSDRAVIEQAFGKCVKNVYSCSEHAVMAMREPAWHSMRLLEDFLIFEVFPDHTLVTNIFNRTLPMIRYRMNDVLTLIPSNEHAPYRAMKDVVGRVEQIAKFVNRHGSTDGISPHTINEILIPHVRRFQMRLSSPDSFQFAVVFDSATGDDQKREALKVADQTLKTILAEKEMHNVSFQILPVNDLPVDPKTGKFRLIVPAPAA